MNDLLDEITGLVGIFLLPESDESSDNVYNESSEDEESEEIIMVSCAMQTHSSSLIASIRTRSSSLIASLLRYLSYNSSLASFIICIISETCECWFCQDEIDEPGSNNLFSYHPLSNNH